MPKLDRRIGAAARHVLAVVGKHQARYRAFVGQAAVLQAAGGCVPQAKFTILASGHEGLAIGSNYQASDLMIETKQGTERFSGGCVPEAHLHIGPLVEFSARG